MFFVAVYCLINMTMTNRAWFLSVILVLDFEEKKKGRGGPIIIKILMKRKKTLILISQVITAIC